MSLLKILKENLSDYVKQNSTIRLYHYSDIDVEQIVLSPSMFNAHGFTRNDAKASDLPRVFFYMNPSQKERIFQNKPEYIVEVPVSQIYHLIDDTLEYKKKIREENNGVLNLDTLLKTVKTAGYRGVYYAPSGIEMVNWFYPIKVTRQVEQEQRVAV